MRYIDIQTKRNNFGDLIVTIYINNEEILTKVYYETEHHLYKENELILEALRIYKENYEI